MFEEKYSAPELIDADTEQTMKPLVRRNDSANTDMVKRKVLELRIDHDSLRICES